MQISRHWRLNSQRYRLQGVRYKNGEVSLQTRPTPPVAQAQSVHFEESKAQKLNLKVAS
jgi:hypothetical protein